jgi:uncharacterized membrane protein YphA (DoxX/SURF4 family)
MPVTRALVGLLHRTVSERTNPSTLALARVFAALASLLALFEAWRVLTRLLRPLVVKIPILPAIPLIPSGALSSFIGVWILASLLFAIGWKTRTAGAVLALLTGYTVVADQQTYSNHLYLLAVVILLLTISDCGAAWSLDARRHGRKADVAAWPILLLKFQLTIVYVFSCAAKLTWPYLDGEILAASLKREGWLALPVILRDPSVMNGVAVASIVAELFIAFGLWSRRFRPLALCAGIGFHLLILGVVETSRLSLAIFALAVFSIYALFVDSALAARLGAPFLALTKGRGVMRSTR